MSESIHVQPRLVKGRVADKEGGTVQEHIEQALRDLRFGTVTIVVQDGVIVQIERTERTRFGRA